MSFFLGKVLVFQSSQYFDQIIFGFWEKTFAKGCQNGIRRVQTKALRLFLKKKLWFCVIFAPWAEKFRTFAKNLRQGFQNVSLSVQGIIFWKTFKKLINFLVLFVFWEKSFRTLSKKIQSRVLRFTFYVSTRTFLKTLLKKWWFPNRFRNLSETFRDFLRKQLRHSFQNINFRVQENILRMFLYRIDGILVFSFLERKTLECWLKINNKVFKTTTYISRELIRDKLFEKKLFSNKTCTLGKKFSTLCKTIRQGLWKLPSACPDEYCEHFSLKKGWVLISFSTLSKINVDFCQTFTAGFPKLQSTCPEKLFEKKN